MKTKIQKSYELFLSDSEPAMFGGKYLGKVVCDEYPRRGDFVSYSDSSMRKEPYFYEVEGIFRCIEGKKKIKGLEKVIQVVVKPLKEKP